MTQTALKTLRDTYKPGERILVHTIEDPYVILNEDTFGTVQKVDDIGTIHVNLDNGMVLGLLYGIDSFKLA